MLQARTLKTLTVLLAVYLAAALPAYFGPAPLEPVGTYAVSVPILSIYLFHSLGMPGLLEHSGHCGWGMCNPTPFGVVFLTAFWLLVFWLVAWLVARLTSGRRSKTEEGSDHG